LLASTGKAAIAYVGEEPWHGLGSGAAGDKLDSAWFGAGYALKEKAWAKATILVS
jgi:hypothetical protein